LKKIVIQIILFFLILLICFFFYKKYFATKEDIVENISKDQIENTENPNNLIKNLKYEVKFENGTQYTITSNLSEITYQGDDEIVLMQIVKAIFKDKDDSILEIISDKAEFNNSTYNTDFNNNVKITYLDNSIQSEKLLLNFEENVVTISDNIIYEGIQGLMKTDNIKIDLISKSVEVFMNNKTDKVEITSKK
jgi:LPS export ABC transporter protein LptC